MPKCSATWAARMPLADQLRERLELVRRMHRQANGVLRQAQLLGAVLGDDLARHGVIGRQLAFLLQLRSAARRRPPATT